MKGRSVESGLAYRIEFPSPDGTLCYSPNSPSTFGDRRESQEDTSSLRVRRLPGIFVINGPLIRWVALLACGSDP